MPASKKAAKKKEVTSVDELNASVNNLHFTLQEQTKQCLIHSCSFVFKNHKNVTALRWQQALHNAADYEPFLRPGDYHVDVIQYFDKQRNEWVSAWNTAHVTSSDLLDDLIEVEHLLLQMPLAQAFGENQITVQPSQVLVDALTPESVQ